MKHCFCAGQAKAVLVAAWTLHCWVVINHYLHCPRLILRSPGSGYGKTSLLKLLAELTPNGWFSEDASPAAIYHRMYDVPGSTILLDEIENSEIWNKRGEYRRLIDGGYRQGGNVKRWIGGEEVEFPIYGPLALAGVGELNYPLQILSRSYLLDMKKHMEGRDMVREGDPYFIAPRNILREFSRTFQRPQNVRFPQELEGRDRDKAVPLIEVGEVCGYGATVRAAVLALHRLNQADDPVTRLSTDIRRIFDQSDRGEGFWTEELLSELHELKDSHWDEFWGLSGNENPHPLTRGELYRLKSDWEFVRALSGRRTRMGTA
jgi:Protein of unknown function (DUF3631)